MLKAKDLLALFRPFLQFSSAVVQEFDLPGSLERFDRQLKRGGHVVTLAMAL